MATNINGVYAGEAHAGMWDAILGGRASIGEADIGDSNTKYGGSSIRGWANGVCLAYKQVCGLPRLSMQPTHGGGTGPSGAPDNAYRDEFGDPYSNTTVLGSALAEMRPWLPVVQATGTLITNYTDAFTNVPTYIAGAAATGNGGPAIESFNNALDFNFREACDMYLAYTVGPNHVAQPGGIKWRVHNGSGTSYGTGTQAVDDATAGFAVTKVLSLAASGARTNQYAYASQCGWNTTHGDSQTGPFCAWSSFLALPDTTIRPHGYSCAPFYVQGGKGIVDQVAIARQLDSRYIQAQIECLAKSMGGRSWYFHPRLRHSLNNQTTAALYRDACIEMLGLLDTAVTAVIAAGKMGSYLGTRPILDLVGQRVSDASDINAANSNLDYAWSGAQLVCDARGDTVAVKHYDQMSNTEAARIAVSGTEVHIATKVAYERREIENMNRYISSVRAAVKYRRIA